MFSKKTGDRDIVVKVYRVGQEGTEVALNGDRSIEAALKAAKLNLKNSEIVQVNGHEIDDDVELEDGDRIVLNKNIEGGNI